MTNGNTSVTTPIQLGKQYILEYRGAYPGRFKNLEPVELLSERPLNKNSYVFIRKGKLGQDVCFFGILNKEGQIIADSCGVPGTYVVGVPELPKGGDWE